MSISRLRVGLSSRFMVMVTVLVFILSVVLVLDLDLGLPKDEMIVFLTDRDLKDIQEAFDVSDVETLKLRKGKGWFGVRPFDKKAAKDLGEKDLHKFM